jgi:D-beta-D-heptose 7-phosphate kinase/D-beta-D-heptose 1-phosphate adenosyltransferase
VLSRQELARHSDRLRADGRRLVLTNGCFDLLHAGHVRYLRQARALGDALAVALNGDASVRRLKGEGRPLNSAYDRAEVLAALEDVDYVTIFDADDAAEIVREVRPAVYVKGGDYSDDPGSRRYPPEADAARDVEAEVAILPFLPGRSTTDLIRKLRSGEQ